MLVDIELPDAVDLPAPADESMRLITEANERVDAFTRSHRPRIDNFVVCDFPLVDSCLQWIVAENLLSGDAFCEWGSGFGVVTLLAALHGLDASGIEVEPDLIDQAVLLAEDFEIEAQFGCGSFIPDDDQGMVETFSEIDHVDTESRSGYDEVDSDLVDFDLFFAFPWPGEHHFFESVFERHAADGAMLLTFQGIEQLRLQRKV